MSVSTNFNLNVNVVIKMFIIGNLRPRGLFFALDFFLCILVNFSLNINFILTINPFKIKEIGSAIHFYTQSRLVVSDDAAYDNSKTKEI